MKCQSIANKKLSFLHISWLLYQFFSNQTKQNKDKFHVFYGFCFIETPICLKKLMGIEIVHIQTPFGMYFMASLLGRHAFHLDFNPCQVRIIICMDIWNAIFTPQWCTNNANQCVVYDNTAATIIYEKNMEKQIIIVNNQKFKLNGIQNNKNENESKLHLQIPVPLVFVVQIIVWSKSELIWIQVGSFSSANNG